MFCCSHRFSAQVIKEVDVQSDSRLFMSKAATLWASMRAMDKQVCVWMCVQLCMCVCVCVVIVHTNLIFWFDLKFPAVDGQGRSIDAAIQLGDGSVSASKKLFLFPFFLILIFFISVLDTRTKCEKLTSSQLLALLMMWVHSHVLFIIYLFLFVTVSFPLPPPSKKTFFHSLTTTLTFSSGRTQTTMTRWR